MATCATCGTTILFGGISSMGARFCGAPCAEKGVLAIAAKNVSSGEAALLAAKIHSGKCGKCGREGPVDIHCSYQIISYIVATNWKTNVHLSCRRCGVRAQVLDLIGSLLGGWWGFPWGLAITPVQIFRNIGGIAKPPQPHLPSESLLNHARMLIASGAEVKPFNQADAGTAPR